MLLKASFCKCNEALVCTTLTERCPDCYALLLAGCATRVPEGSVHCGEGEAGETAEDSPGRGRGGVSQDGILPSRVIGGLGLWLDSPGGGRGGVSQDGILPSHVSQIM